MASSPTVELRQRISDLLGIREQTPAKTVERSQVPFGTDEQLETKALQQRSPRASDLFPVAIARKDVSTIGAAGETLAQLLDKPDLNAAINALVVKQADRRERFERNLSSFAVMADSALTMLDYDKLGTGWEGWGMS